MGIRAEGYGAAATRLYENSRKSVIKTTDGARRKTTACVAGRRRGGSKCDAKEHYNKRSGRRHCRSRRRWKERSDAYRKNDEKKNSHKSRETAENGIRLAVDDGALSTREYDDQDEDAVTTRPVDRYYKNNKRYC